MFTWVSQSRIISLAAMSFLLAVGSLPNIINIPRTIVSNLLTLHTTLFSISCGSLKTLQHPLFLYIHNIISPLILFIPRRLKT